jgi:predicted nucleic acid-binding protein
LSRRKFKILVDTSFLLPTLGFETRKEIMDVVSKFSRHEIYYLEISITEALWSILKKLRSEKLEVVVRGVEAIKNTYKALTPRPDDYRLAMQLYFKGHHDMIDNLFYASALNRSLKFLTVDQKLVNFIGKNNLPTKIFLKLDEI